MVDLQYSSTANSVESGEFTGAVKYLIFCSTAPKKKLLVPLDSSDNST